MNAAGMEFVMKDYVIAMKIILVLIVQYSQKLN